MAATNSEWLTCGLTKARLLSIDDILAFQIDSADREFSQLVLHTVKLGGKKLRPTLFMLAVKTGDYYEKDLLFPAAAVELIHIASLHHDDVMDRAETRRNEASVNARWGNVNATYSGNYLFSKAISMLSDYNQEINQITCQYVADLCLGQLKEAENAYNLQLPVDDHLLHIRQKTGSLFELPCKLGAILSNADRYTVDAMVSYGQSLGIAFQLIDDILDLKGDPVKTGKEIGKDLREGVYSYATLHALNYPATQAELRQLLLIEDMKREHIDRAIELIKSSGGIARAREQAEAYITEATSAIAFLSEGTTKQSLLNLAAFILSRDH
ncbi:polyprenyl synthetase family protein [Dyadobacter sp. Leaf189]|uniref:polyprenyl synthetase family protein n=1 Tax=Dyadobacter sp. Leaf189 TaxID=1736295 RepID=UPI0006F82DFB|nr:polyprenyl synthetase family protein [Dyadobacter sp. Leaf189]KQS27062.1 hypothetical protein ASG33_21250 [Dyadobacter sp. Leaf189]